MTNKQHLHRNDKQQITTKTKKTKLNIENQNKFLYRKRKYDLHYKMNYIF